MKFYFDSGNKKYFFDTAYPLEISIPVQFNGSQPNTYDVPAASAKAFETGNFVGDTRRGGGCNFEEYKIIAHCNGTHTECVGHISFERISVNETLKESFLPATLISVLPDKANETGDTYIPEKNKDDYLITKKSLEEKLENADSNFLKAVIIRTLPNDDSKKSRQYMKNFPPFFSIESIKYICDLGTEHLLIDMPSVDRTFDEGKLTVHHIFWNVKFESHEVNKKNHSLKTITEMAYVDNKIPDGKYLLNIQIPDFIGDAAPSRLMLYQLTDS